MIREDNIQRARQIIEQEYGCAILDIEYKDEMALMSFIDTEGYKYCSNNLSIICKYKIFPIHKNNPYVLENISLFLLKEDSSFELSNNNSYTNNTSKMSLTCKTCGETVFTTWSSLQNHNNLFHMCYSSKDPLSIKNKTNKSLQNDRPVIIKPGGSFGDRFSELLDEWDHDKNGSPYKYSPFSEEKVFWTCRVCGHHWKAEIQSRTGNKYGTKHRTGCSVCASKKTESSYQQKTREFLETLGYTIAHERGCSLIPTNPTTNYPLMYDNEVVELKLIIEVNGDHHYNRLNGYHAYQAKRKGTTRDEEFEYQVYKDNYKEQYALENGYSYLKLPYSEFDNEDRYKDTILNTIDFIINTR